MSGPFDDDYAACYDLLYGDKDYAAEAAFVARALKQFGVRGQSILDLGSGTGRHALALARLGYDVLGVDKSDAMVRIAGQHGPLDSSGRPQFETGDVRTFRCGRLFDAVVSLFHVVSYQTLNDDLMATFETAVHHLNRGGLFLFDCWYGPAVLTERPSVRVKQVETESLTVIRIAEPTIDVRNNLVVIDYTMLVQSVASASRKVRERHILRYLFEPEVRDLLERTGFAVCDARESGTGRPLGADTWSATFVAKRR